MTDTIEHRIDRLESRFALLDLVSDYCHGFDKHDWDRFLAIWWEDCTWEIGPPFGDFHGHEGIARAVKEILWPAWKASSHFTTNLVVQFTDRDHANGICDVDCIGTTADEVAQTVSATYTDEYERRGDVWKIKRRKVTMHHFSALTGVTLAPPQ
ncbi:nuclear transport factor 2 family protein [Sphingomonas sp.]|jgi:gamma-hexachlorocyclohexane dehydrochlorinase|uniref:nuclear transport factor 2 family protein n=1 Tax=Sphingomonas sp. TaxID=28214 RepID=UPI002DEB23A5|nr:nuclear transport factor 2 family protein [Sphingomonas sp.]